MHNLKKNTLKILLIMTAHVSTFEIIAKRIAARNYIFTKFEQFRTKGKIKSNVKIQKGY